MNISEVSLLLSIYGPLNVTISTDPPLHNMFCKNETVILICTASDGATQPNYQWSTDNLSIAGQTSKIVVYAALEPVEYHCKVSDETTGKQGQASITIVVDGFSPTLKEINFDEIMIQIEGESVNLTVEVITNLSLTADPTWSKLDDQLPSKATVINYTSGNQTYSTLGLPNLTSFIDTGNYTLTASNRCGTSSTFVYMDVKGLNSNCPSLTPTPKLLRGCVDTETVDDESVVFDCIFGANFTRFVLLTAHYWIIKFPDGHNKPVDGSGDDYFVLLQQDCPSQIDEPCCRVKSSLMITNATLSLNNAMVSCYAGLKFPNSEKSSISANLTIYVQPKLIAAPTNVTIKKNNVAHFKCQCNSSTLQYFTLFKWLRDSNTIANDNNKYQISGGPVSHQVNMVYSELSILNVTEDDEGSYSCYCYYNQTMLSRIHISKQFKSNTRSAVLTLTNEDYDHKLSYGKVTAILCSIVVFIIVLVVVIITLYYRIASRRYMSSHMSGSLTHLLPDVIDDHPTIDREHNQQNDTQPVGIHKKLKSYTDKFDPLVSGKVKHVKAQSPPGGINDIEIDIFDERGGVFHSHNHGVTVVVPSGAIPRGTIAELKFAAMLIAPLKFSRENIPVSAMYWLCMSVKLQKPVLLFIPHIVQIDSEADAKDLSVVKFHHGQESMEMIGGGRFNVKRSYGYIEVSHFCYFCIVEAKLDASKIPHNKYGVVSVKQKQPSHCIWKVDICVLPYLRTCQERLKDQYDCEWEFQWLSPFSFSQGCDELDIEITDCEWQGIARVSNNKYTICQEEVDFHQYYSDVELQEELKMKMEHKLYPPRFRVAIQANDERFFQQSNCFTINLFGGRRKLHELVQVPAVDPFSYSYSLESPISRTGNFDGANNGYSDDSIEKPLPNEDKMAPGELNLRNLMVHTEVLKNKWTALGYALGVPSSKIEKINDKYHDKPLSALVRVYRYWLAEENGFIPTWKKLIDALRLMKEINLCVQITKTLESDDQFPLSVGDSSEPEKDLVMQHIKIDLLNLTYLIPLLNKYQLLTRDDNYELLNTANSPEQRANLLLYLILPSKGPNAYKLFIKCLKEEKESRGHRELARMLTGSLI
ncbi:uncharacterized protein [Dysidea avara]|uniref:uncharacterized protein isoform X3 n=1 Tax=Dysidea avara TaxID=196820 RepID=UPI00331D7B03